MKQKSSLRVLMTKAFNSAVAHLSRREHGAKELAQKLAVKGFQQDEIDEAMLSCQRLDLQNDERYVEQLVRLRIQQGYGPLKISHELKSKGIASELISNKLQVEQDNWLSYAEHVWRKRCKGQAPLSLSELQKQQRYLFYRGFSQDTIVQLMRQCRLGEEFTE